MNNTINIKASIISGICEVILTHPIDYVKTIVQNKSKLQFKDLIKGSYKGLSSRLIGIVHMRILFWNSLEYFKAVLRRSLGVYMLLDNTSLNSSPSKSITFSPLDRRLSTSSFEMVVLPADESPVTQ